MLDEVFTVCIGAAQESTHALKRSLCGWHCWAAGTKGAGARMGLSATKRKRRRTGASQHGRVVRSSAARAARGINTIYGVAGAGP